MKRKSVYTLTQPILCGAMLLAVQADAKSQDVDLVTEAFDLALVERLASYHPELLAPVEATPVAIEPSVQIPIHSVTYKTQADEELFSEFDQLIAPDLTLNVVLGVSDSEKVIPVPEVSSAVLVLSILPLITCRRKV